MKSLLKLLWILLLFSCQEEDVVKRQINDQGVVIATPYLWKKPLHEKDVISNGYIMLPVYYNGNILIPTTNGTVHDNIHKFTLVDAVNGKTVWDWDDQFGPKIYNMYIDDCIQYKNLFIYQSGSKSYCINLNDGCILKEATTPNSRY